MKNIIIRRSSVQIAVLVITADEKLSHSLAETISYVENGNAIYGLFGMATVSRNELLAMPGGIDAYNCFQSACGGL